jgi:hypothetical protein
LCRSSKEGTSQGKDESNEEGSPKKKGGSAEAKNKDQQQPAEPVPAAKRKKSATALTLRLATTTGNQCPSMMKSVSLLTNNGAQGAKLAEHFRGVNKIQKSLHSIYEKLHLFGNIPRPSKLAMKGKANVNACDVEWEDIASGETKTDLQVVVPAPESSDQVRHRQKNIDQKSGCPRKHPTDKLFDNDIATSLFVIHEGEDGDPVDSDSANEEDDENEEEESDKDEFFVAAEARQEDLQVTKESHLEETETRNAEGSSRFQWRAGQHISAPHGISNHRPSSVVKPESVGCFR